MSNRRSRSRKTSRKAYIQAPREREALFWPTILLQFSDWLIENSWATDQLTALAAAMTIDRSVRERNVSVYGADFPIDMFCLDDHEYPDFDEYEQSPRERDEIRRAVHLFGRFVIAERLSPSQNEEISREIGSSTAVAPVPSSSVSPGRASPLSTPIVVSLLQRLATWAATERCATSARIDYWNDSAEIVAALGIPGFDSVATQPDFMAMVNYRSVLDTARRVGVLENAGQNYTRGPEAGAWVVSPSADRTRAAVVEAYGSCLTPVYDSGDDSVQSELVAGSALATTVLARSLVGDPVGESEGVVLGTMSDRKLIQTVTTLRFMSMFDLGLLVKVNDKFCVPDPLAPLLLEALDRDRLRRTGRAS
ncbi:hypothetical protein AB0362_15605 [Rhodococcus sp. NPDC079359]|uniref:hypothetical protein n=1 Tax=Rhodococcus sp. NPDC079359 TaxID=3154961 RepID=UPI00344EE9F6